MTEPTTFDDDDFQKPKSNEKKDKKAKRAEEKRRQKEAKRAAAAAEAAQADYIPGAPRPQQDRPQVVHGFSLGNFSDRVRQLCIRTSLTIQLA